MRSLSSLALQCSMRARTVERKCPSTVDTVFQVCFERHITLNKFHILLRYQIFFLGARVGVGGTSKHTYMLAFRERPCHVIDLTQ